LFGVLAPSAFDVKAEQRLARFVHGRIDRQRSVQVALSLRSIPRTQSCHAAAEFGFHLLALRRRVDFLLDVGGRWRSAESRHFRRGCRCTVHINGSAGIFRVGLA
jgi:hypothetical protein